MSHSMQGVYAPLPQSLSDSDSEKEVSMEPVFANYTKNGSKVTLKASLSSSHNGHLFNNLNDEVVKVKRIKPKMSTLRKTAFVFSILLCFLPIVIFLWVLPCSDTNTCPVKISNWESQLYDVEFKGDIGLVQGQQNLNLALMYKGSFNVPKILKNGVMSFLGKNGAVAWDFRQESCPLLMNCTSIDVDKDGLKDCLIVDEAGLKTVEVVSGEAIWHAHSAQEKSIPNLDMPVILEDFDQDGIEELLSVYQKKKFFLISGKNGRILLDVKIVTTCSVIENLHRIDRNIRYHCVMLNKTDQLFQISVSQIKAKYINHKEIILPQQVHEEVNKFFITGNKKLSVETRGLCPHCMSKLIVFDSKDIPIKSWTYGNTYAMTPVAFDMSFSKTVASPYENVNGFVFKIWEWHDLPKKLSPVTHVHRRSVPIYNETYHLNQVSERVVLIIFYENSTDTINVSMTDIYVICNGPDLKDCQPSYRNQQNSLLIADLDHDKSLELISYYSSYIKTEENGYDNWHLISKVKVFRLESELPKLFGNIKLK